MDTIPILSFFLSSTGKKVLRGTTWKFIARLTARLLLNFYQVRCVANLFYNMVVSWTYNGRFEVVRHTRQGTT